MTRWSLIWAMVAGSVPSMVWRDDRGMEIEWLDFSDYRGQIKRTRAILLT